VVFKLTGRDITFGEIEQQAAVSPASVPPSFVDLTATESVETDAGVPTTLSVTLEEGRYVVGCATPPDDTDTMHPAELLRVDGS
jgi:hypothetical protein